MSTEKLKTRVVVGWRHRESEVRSTRSRMRASSAAFKAATPAATASKKKTEPVT